MDLFHLKVSKSPFQPSSSQFFPSYKAVNLKMAAQHQPLDMMDRMVAARYAPLVLPQPLLLFLVEITKSTYLGLIDKVRQQLRSIGMHFSAMQIIRISRQNMCGSGCSYIVWMERSKDGPESYQQTLLL